LHRVIHVIPPLGVKEGVVEKNLPTTRASGTLFSGTRKKDLAQIILNPVVLMLRHILMLLNDSLYLHFDKMEYGKL
jgi:hypothetical protein